MAQRAGALPRFPPSIVAASAGAVWGGFGYALLWGHTTWSVGRPFVVSTVGFLALLPVRTVLWSIHLAERRAGRSFALADSNWWIGLAAAGVGAAIVVTLLFVVRFVLRRVRS
ncbi:MAG TPA: hypothetical protein VGB51_10335 [Actinomycetota bacterium]